MNKFVGELTLHLRNDYLKNKVKTGEITQKQARSGDILSFKPLTDKLYFWQLGYIISSETLYQLISTFYNRVFNDDEEWFRKVFVELGDKNHHIERQHLFWMDVFYGRSEYRGGKKGLLFHHKLAKEIMTTKGAKRWMMHMNKAVGETNLNIDDPRVESTLRDFLNFTMETYGIQFDFNVVDWIHTISSRL